MPGYKLYIAADPGKEGALVCLDQDGMLVDRIATPRIGSTGPVDLAIEYRFCFEMRNKNPDKIVFLIEDVHALYGVSTSSTSSLMENKGQLTGMFFTLSMIYKNSSLHFIAPKTWQKTVWSHSDKVMLANKVDTKKTSLACAKRLWPGDSFLKNDRCKVPHDGIVDAMLIAEAGRRLF